MICGFVNAPLVSSIQTTTLIFSKNIHYILERYMHGKRISVHFMSTTDNKNVATILLKLSTLLGLRLLIRSHTQPIPMKKKFIKAK